MDPQDCMIVPCKCMPRSFSVDSDPPLSTSNSSSLGGLSEASFTRCSIFAKSYIATLLLCRVWIDFLGWAHLPRAAALSIVKMLHFASSMYYHPRGVEPRRVGEREHGCTKKRLESQRGRERLHEAIV